MCKRIAALFVAALLIPAVSATAQTVRPPNGTYTYTQSANGKPVLTSTVVIAGTGDTFTVAESAAIDPEKRVYVVRTFNANTLLPTHYELHQRPSTGPTSDLAADITPSAATFAGLPLAYKTLPDTKFVLLGEGLIAFRIMLASVELANNNDPFTLGALNGNTSTAGKVVASTAVRPASVPANDMQMGIVVGDERVTIWYDPRTRVTDEIDAPNGTVIHRDAYDTHVQAMQVSEKIASLTLAPAHYTDRQVSFAAATATLSGVLSIPGPATYPAVVFVHGSGPGTRDGGTPANPTFLALSNTLANAGIAVLRYDKRGIGKSTGTATEDWRPLAEDLAAAVTFLQHQQNIDAQQIFILGHSEGGFVVAECANQPGVRGVIEMAGPAITLAAILEKQGLASMAPAAQKRLADAFAAYANIDPADLVAASRRPMLLLQGGKDSQVLAADFPRLTDAAKRAHVAATAEIFPEDDHLFIRLPDSQAIERAEIFEPHELDPRVGDAIIRWIRTIAPATR
jgi:alpha-beta hydrolase superfamily lysophospholipase